jgi:hypothetical protein
MSESQLPALTGGCLCGGVRYRISGPRRDVICCHCENCRRTHGHFAAYTAVLKSDLEMLSSTTLQWFHDRGPDTLRGFCNVCGASLFWDANDASDKLSVAAGSLDDSAELKLVGHIFLTEAGRYYSIEDGLPQFPHGSGGALDGDDGG